MSSNKTALDVLFIEDTGEDAELTVLNLGRAGFSINWKRVDSESALRGMLVAWAPDIILSDYSMPGFSGHEALRICRELTPDIPFIFLSGTIGEELAIESIHHGATDYVLKDSMRRLSTSVQRAIADVEKRRIAREADKERSRLIAILEATSDIVVIADPDGSLNYINQGARKLLGISADARAQTITGFMPEPQWQLIRSLLPDNRGEDSIWQGDSVVRDGAGIHVPVSLVVIAHREASASIKYFSFLARDVREREAYEEQIRHLANFDPLTQLPNRMLLADRVSQAIGHCHWSSRTLAVLMIDIDRFKLVNDGYGHAIGDTLLKKFGERLRGSLRARDTIARMSADCFAVLATDLASPEDVVVLVAKLQESLAEPFVIDAHDLKISTGIGISLFPRDGGDFTDLIRNADMAMHRLKETGESGFCFYASEMTRSVEQRVRLETELHHAIDKREFELYYQVQRALGTDEVMGFEALIRWNHPDKGVMPPGLFIPIAENSELICPIGEWALREACRQLTEWDRLSHKRLRISVNVSARQFRSKGFVQLVAQALQGCQLEPGRLELELTESILLDDYQEAQAILEELNKLGVLIALDDFGTGYSNLSYLSRLPIHCLKIDRSFVQQALIDNSDAEIVRAIISLADALRLRVVAEGIETVEQLDFLKANNCAEGQGYYFARPQPASEIPVMLAAPTQHSDLKAN